MKKIYFILLPLFFMFITSAVLLADEEFGQYRYTKFVGVQQQLQAQRMNAIRRQRLQNQVPTRNIRYPNTNNPYPNIQRANYAAKINPRQRYSSQYYNRYYR